MKPKRRLLLSLTALWCVLALTAPGAATAQSQPPGIVVAGGLSQPVFPFTDAIEERLWVETPLDTDSDGRLDRVRIDLSRPGATATADLNVPVILEASPYRSGTWNDVPYHDDLNPDELPQSDLAHQGDSGPGPGRGPAPDLPGSLDNYYVPRGYGVVLAQSVGTAQSDGCPTTGDDAETQSAKAVIDWLNGRAQAFDADGNPVDADWTTGQVGMTGASYNGTIPNQIATTGVEGLKTIVPVVAISDWYNYYRENGLVVAPGGFQGEDADVLARYVAGEARAEGDCFDEIAAIEQAQDRVTGDYNAFWDARNYLPGVGNITASVFVVDGRNDWNVKPSQWGQWWEQLAAHDVPRKIWLHNGGHGTPGNNATYTLPSGQSWTYQTTVHRWFDHWLWGVDNGIMEEPRAVVQREDSTNTTSADWPEPGAEEVRVNLTASAADESGSLTSADIDPPKQASQSFVDNGRNQRPLNTMLGQPALVASPDEATGRRLVYRSSVLENPVRLSGTPTIHLRASVDNASAANLAAYLVDYGPPGSTSATMVTRGWMDVQNRVRRDKTDAIMTGKAYDFSWAFHPDDYVFRAGRRIGVVVMSTDYDHTLRPDPGTRLTVRPGWSFVTLPIVGGTTALGF